MSQVPYWKKLQDPRWQRKRLEVFEMWGFRCCACGDESRQLQIHHEYYVSGREPWEYPTESFRALCDECHKREKEKGRIIKDWEILVGMENANKNCFGSESGLFDVLKEESVKALDIPPNELLFILRDAVCFRLITPEIISDWKLKIADNLLEASK